MTTTYIPFSDVLAEDLKDPETAEAWEHEYLAREVAIWVIRYRSDHHLTQAALGRLLGMKQQAIGRLEEGEVTPSLDTIRHLCKTLRGAMTLHIDPAGWMSVDLYWE